MYSANIYSTSPYTGMLDEIHYSHVCRQCAWSRKGETMNMQGVSQIYTLVYITNTRGGACMTLKYGFIAWIYIYGCMY